jgi:16S rRNA (guanine527-N7)-methyltransferase
VPVLSAARIAELLEPFVSAAPGTGAGLNLSPGLIDGLSVYLDLLVRWNARVSLTSIRTPEEMIQRHFGESLFTASVLKARLPAGAEILDFGSGAGFPGLPLQMVLPETRVTVAESQARKVAFLREVIRTLGLQAEVWPHRVEEMPAERLFDVVTMRAVDRMELARQAAEQRVRPDSWLALLAGGEAAEVAEAYSVPCSERRWLILHRLQSSS